jgi:SAM-dependent methyltransferase
MNTLKKEVFPLNQATMFQKINRSIQADFLKKYASDKKTLDLGSGGDPYGYGQYFQNRVTVDIDPLRKPEIVADAHHLPFREGEFDVVLSIEMLEHVKNPFQVAAEIKRVLKPGGLLLLTTRFVYPLHDAPHDYFRFTKYGLKELFGDLEIIELTAEAALFTSLAILYQRIAFQTRLRFNKPLKFLLFLRAWLLCRLDFLVLAQYGNIQKTREERDILATGYYLAARKRS